MSSPPKKPIEPLTTLKGVGYAGRKKIEQGRRPSEGEKALVALDNIMTESMRQAGYLPPSAQRIAPPASPAFATASLPNIADYDPMQMPVWTLLMALAWIATKNIERVTWQRDEWRRENGLPKGSIPIVSVSAMEGIGDEIDGAGDPTAFRALDAFDLLRAAAEGGKVEVRAMAVDRNEPAVLRPIDWTYGKLSFNNQYDEVWRVGGELYHSLSIERDNLLSAFPPVDSEGVDRKAARAPLPGDARPTAFTALLPRAGSKTRAILVAAWDLWKGAPPPYDGIGRRDDALFARMQSINPDFKARPDRETFRIAMEKYEVAVSSETPPN